MKQLKTQRAEKINLKNGCVKHRVFMVMLSRQFAIILTQYVIIS